MLVTVDYARDRAPYLRALEKALTGAPKEAFVSGKPTLARNRNAVADTFETTLFSVTAERLPANCKVRYNALKPTQRSLSGFLRLFENEQEELRRVLEGLEDVARPGIIFPEPLPAFDESTTEREMVDIILGGDELNRDAQNTLAVHARGPDLEEAPSNADPEESPLGELV